MFEMYMEGHSVDPRTRARMMMALMASLVVTTAAGTLSWGAGRLSIGRVGPPQGAEFMQLTLLRETPLPKAELPDRPERPKTEAQPSAVATKTTTRPRRGEPNPEPDGPPVEGASRSRPSGDPSGTPDGHDGKLGPNNQVGCLGPMCVHNAPIGRPPVGVPRPTRTSDETRERAPLSVLKARGIYTPDPKAAALAKTKTGLGSRAPGRVKVAFCVGPNGKVSSAKVAKGFGSDHQVDRICRDAVKAWRFKPARIDGQAKTTCSDVTFEIRFE